MTPLARGILSSGKLGAAGTPTFAVSTVLLNTTTQYLQLQGSSSRLDVGLDTVAIEGWGHYDGSSGIIIYSKQLTNGSSQRIEFIVAGTGALMNIQINFGGAHLTVDANFPAMSIGWHHFMVYWDRTINDESSTHFYLDSVEITNKTVAAITGSINSEDIVLGNSVTFGFREWLSSYQSAPAFIGVAIGQPLTQTDATYSYNSGDAICWPDVATDNPTLYAKFAEVFDLGTFNGSTELQSLTGKVNGWILTNVNSAPFTGTGLIVECS